MMITYSESIHVNLNSYLTDSITDHGDKNKAFYFIADILNFAVLSNEAKLTTTLPKIENEEIRILNEMFENSAGQDFTNILRILFSKVNQDKQIEKPSVKDLLERLSGQTITSDMLQLITEIQSTEPLEGKIEEDQSGLLRI